MTDFNAAARTATTALRTLFPETPLQRNDFLSARYGADIWLKREDLSPVRSFKLRGAFNAMRKVRERAPDQTRFVCASAGNHAQGMAYSCRHFGVYGTIFMPTTTPQQKIDKTRAFGGEWVEIVLTGDYFDRTLAAAKTWCEAEGAHFLAPFDDADVVEGQASVAVEMLDQLGRTPDMVLLSVGGGGLASGVTKYLRETSPATQFRFVEPSGGASLRAALLAGRPMALDSVDSFVDGAAVARIGDVPFAALSWAFPDQVLMAPEDRICVTMVEMLNIEGVVLEPAGAMPISVLGDLGPAIQGKTVVCVISGGNFDFERLPEVKERAQRYTGLKKYMLLRLPQRPGALRDFLGLLGPDDDVARFEYLKKSTRNFGSILIGIETKAAENFPVLFAKMDKEGFAFRDITQDALLGEYLI